MVLCFIFLHVTFLNVTFFFDIFLHFLHLSLSFSLLFFIFSYIFYPFPPPSWPVLFRRLDPQMVRKSKCLLLEVLDVFLSMVRRIGLFGGKNF